MMQERMGTICLLVAGCSTLLLISVLLFMFLESWSVWSAVSPLAFILGTDWNPLAEPLQLGIGTMILSTLWTALGALLLAVPLGLCCAIFLAEFAPQWVANILRPVLNLLTGIPSVVYGFLGATVLVKFFEINFAMASGESLFCASLVLTIMVLPYIISTSESALRAIPPEYRQVSLALGVSKPYLTLRVLLPLAKRGLLGAIILSFGRAAGETMAVLMLAGNTMVLPTSWFSKGEPLPALIALELGTSEVGSLHYQGLFAAGLVLLLFVLGMNLLLALFRRDRRSGVS